MACIWITWKKKIYKNLLQPSIYGIILALWWSTNMFFIWNNNKIVFSFISLFVVMFVLPTSLLCHHTIPSSCFCCLFFCFLCVLYDVSVTVVSQSAVALCANVIVSQLDMLLCVVVVVDWSESIRTDPYRPHYTSSVSAKHIAMKWQLPHHDVNKINCLGNNLKNIV